MTNIVVRVAEPDDADAMGRVHVEAWQAAYTGIMPEDFLTSLDATARAAEWRAVMERNPNPEEGRRLVAELGDTVVGLALVWPGRQKDEKGLGELIMINTAPSAWGTGAGTALLAGCVDGLTQLGFAEAVLWVAADNARARRFYEREGWRTDGASKSDDFGGTIVEELRYRRSLCETSL
ncbi:MAG: GNAT family N-acetyltransferase [Acidimicrobiia bacterium]|nr:GNAT family N-acetyltransferase [Acidimicrobiia bacterium]